MTALFFMCDLDADVLLRLHWFRFFIYRTETVSCPLHPFINNLKGIESLPINYLNPKTPITNFHTNQSIFKRNKCCHL